jgi:hypothetical protein
MKDEAPRIFRSLEKEAGRGGFDTVVRAAVANYAALRNPSEHRARSLGRLLVPVWDRLSRDTQSAIARSLATAPSLPRNVVDCLLAAPADITGPFLRSSPCLGADDLAGQAASSDPRRRSLAEERSEQLAAAPALPPQPAPVAYGPAAATSEDLSPARPKTAAEARATLMKLVQPGSAPRKAAARPAGTVAGIIAAARAGEVDDAYAGLATMLGLDPATMAELVAEPQGDILAAALKALRLGSGDALTIIMLLKPRIGLDVGAFDAMKTRYRQLDADICRTRLRIAAPGASRIASPALQPKAAELEPRLRAAAAPRAAFGRRRTAPAAGSAVSGIR